MTSEICECGHERWIHDWLFSKSTECSATNCECKKFTPQNNSPQSKSSSKEKSEDKEPEEASPRKASGSDNNSPPIQRDGSKTEDKIDSDKDYLTSSGSDNQVKHKNCIDCGTWEGSDDDSSLSDKIEGDGNDIVGMSPRIKVKYVSEAVKK